MLRKVVNENTRVPYSNEISLGALPLDKAEGLATHTMLAYFDPRFPKEEIPVDIRSIAKLTNRKLSNVKRQCAAAAVTLPGKVFYKLDPTKKKRPGDLFSFDGIPVFQKISFVEESNLLLGIFNEEFIPYLIANPETPIYRLTMLYDFRSKYTSRVLAKVIRAWLDNKKQNPVFIAKEEMMFSVLGGKKEKGENSSLFSVGAFNQNALVPSRRDINNHSKCPVEVEYEEVEDKTGHGGNYATLGWNWTVEEKPGQSIEVFMDKIDMTDDLIHRGFPRSLAQKVIHEKSWNIIRRNIAYFDSHVKTKDKKPEQLGKILYKFIFDDEEKKNRNEKQAAFVPVTTSPTVMSSLFAEEEPITAAELESDFIKELRSSSPHTSNIMNQIEERVINKKEARVILE